MREVLLASGILLLVLSGCDLLGGEDDGEKPELTGKFIFSSAQSGSYQIYTMNADGTDRKQLTFDVDSTERPEEAASPSWSPDGERIVFITTRKATTLGMSLYLMDADGSNLRPLKRFATESPQVLYGSRPVWSPNGKRIAYYVCANCELGGRDYEIATVEVAGEDYKDHHAVTDHPAADRFPTWSPDGEKIAFVSNRAYLQTEDPSRQDLYVADADGSNLRRLTEMGGVGPPAWSPDGKKIAFAWQRRDADAFLYSLASEEVTRLTDLKYVGRPRWHPNSKYLLIPGTTHQGKKVCQLLNLSSDKHSMRECSDGEDYDWFVETKE